jgi:hypothetical protein
MTITIDLTPELEQRLREAASAAGVAIDSFIIRSVEQQLGPTRAAENGHRLSSEEAELLLKINDTLSSFPWQRHHELAAKRQDEALTVSEQAELMVLSDQTETAAGQRMTLVAALAEVRKISMPALLAELGLQPRSHE